MNSDGFKRFEDPIAWQRAHELARNIYKTTLRSNFNRDFALRDQIRRAALSPMCNIAEGYARSGPKEFLRFLDIARGSSAEVQSLLYIAKASEYISAEEFRQLYELADEVTALIAGLTRSLRVKQFQRQQAT